MQRNRAIFIVVFVSLLLAGGVTFFVMLSDGVTAIDQYIINIVGTIDSPAFHSFIIFITKLGSHVFLIPFTLVVMFFLYCLYRDWLSPLILAVGTLTGLILNRVIKVLVARERPQILVEADAEGYSFPSGHSMIPIICYGLLMCFLILHPKTKDWKKIYIIFFPILIVTVAFSRVMLNVHYFTDIVAGLMLGLNLVILFFAIYRYLRRDKISEWSMDRERKETP